MLRVGEHEVEGGKDATPRWDLDKWRAWLLVSCLPSPSPF